MERAGGVYCFSDGTVIGAPYQVGDILYVRETFFEYLGKYYYKADEKHLVLSARLGNKEFFKWHPSIHMPKEAARLFLRVTGVRVERLQDISDEDAEKEGCEDYTSTALGFPWVWDGTIPKKDLDRYGWNANPWIWVVEFERISKEKESLLLNEERLKLFEDRKTMLQGLML